MGRTNSLGRSERTLERHVDQDRRHPHRFRPRSSSLLPSPTYTHRPGEHAACRRCLGSRRMGLPPSHLAGERDGVNDRWVWE